MTANGHLPAGHVALDVRRRGLGYVAVVPNTPIRFEATELSHSRGRALISICLDDGRAWPSRYRANLELLGAQTPERLYKLIAGLTIAHDAPWQALIAAFLDRVVDMEREGEPSELRGGPRRERPPAVPLVERLLERGKPTMIYGPGGFGKGYLAIALCVHIALGRPFLGLSVAQGAPYYLDWEDDGDEFDKRVWEICEGLGVEPPQILYRRCRRPLAQDLEFVSTEIDRIGASLTVIDSVEMASQFSEHASVTDRAVMFGQAVRQLNTASLLIDHVSNEGRRGKELAGKSINSVMKQNFVRNQWEVKCEHKWGGTGLTVGVYNVKTNHDRLWPPVGIHMNWSQQGACELKRADIRDSATLSAALPGQIQIRDWLVMQGAHTIKQIAAALDMTEKAVEGHLLRGEGTLFVEATPGHRGRGGAASWGAAE